MTIGGAIVPVELDEALLAARVAISQMFDQAVDAMNRRPVDLLLAVARIQRARAAIETIEREQRRLLVDLDDARRTIAQQAAQIDRDRKAIRDAAVERFDGLTAPSSN